MVPARAGGQEGSDAAGIVEHNTAYHEGPGETSFANIGDVPGVRMRNNICVTLTDVDYSRCISIARPIDDIEMGAHLFYAPNISADAFEPFWVNQQGYSASAWETATGTTIPIADPMFLSTSPSELDFLRPASGSPAVDAAEDAAVFSDFDRRLRPADGNSDGAALWDFGAHEYQP